MLERWSRQMAIPQFGLKIQRRLGEGKVAVLGVGGLGSPAAIYLAAAGIGHMVLVDRDTVELSNLNRQILFCTSDIGRSKVEAAAARLRQLDPGLKIEAVVEDAKEDRLRELIAGCDFVLDCFDRNADRLAVNRMCISQGIPAAHGFAQNFSGEIFVVTPGQSACLACVLDESFPEAEETPAIGAATGMIGTAMAAAAIRSLTGVGDLAAGQRLIYDLAFPEMMKIPISRNRLCPECSR